MNGKKSHCNDDESLSAGKKQQHDKPKESFEPIPLLVACLTYLGFQFLMLLGFLNQLIFPPKVAIERNREVSHLEMAQFRPISNAIYQNMTLV